MYLVFKSIIFYQSSGIYPKPYLSQFLTIAFFFTTLEKVRIFCRAPRIKLKRPISRHLPPDHARITQRAQITATPCFIPFEREGDSFHKTNSLSFSEFSSIKFRLYVETRNVSDAVFKSNNANYVSAPAPPASKKRNK